MVAVSVCLATAQTNTIKHTVDRGETLTSIAKRYATTEAKIIELNPDAAQFIYVGMELTIPVVSSSSESNVTAKMVVADSDKPIEVPTASYYQEEKAVDNQDEEGRLRFCSNVGFGFLDKPLDKGFALSCDVTFGVNYTVVADFYVGGRIGCNSPSFSYDRKTYEYYFLSIPVEAGYMFVVKDRKFGVVPFLGFDFNIGLTGRYKDKSVSKESLKLKIGGKLAADFIIGTRIRLGDFDIGAGYHIPINDWQKTCFGKDAYPSVFIGYGF